MRSCSVTVVIALCIVLLASVSPAQQGNVTNYSFEQPVLVYPFVCGLFYGSCPPIPGWNWAHSPVNGPTGDALLLAVGYSSSQGTVTTAGQGNQFVTLGGGYSCGVNNSCVGGLPDILYQFES